MAQSYRCSAPRRSRMWTSGWMGALSLAFLAAGADRASACSGLDCVGEAVWSRAWPRSRPCAGESAQTTGYAVDLGVTGLGHKVQGTAQATRPCPQRSRPRRQPLGDGPSIGMGFAGLAYAAFAALADVLCLRAS